MDCLTPFNVAAETEDIHKDFIMQSGRRAILFATCGLLFALSAAAQEKDVSRETLEAMRRNVASLSAVSRSPDGESPLKLVTTPVLRYSDPGGITTDASVWVWGGQGRPAMVAGIFFLTQEGRDSKWSCELLSLADGPVAVSSGAGWSWTPNTGGLKWLAIDDPPADTSRERLRQMKAIAERYEITSLKSQLRLLVQPLYRYADEERGLIDGAIFSYAAGTNPETLLLVECRKSDDAPAWQAAFARFGANGCQARKGEAVVWECPAIQSWDVKAPYFSQFGPAERVFAAVGQK